jgi:RNA-directed DNA polymerase
MTSVTQFITQRLKLKVNAEKSAVARPGKRKFLGFSLSHGKEPKRRIAAKALQRFKMRVRKLTGRMRGRSVEQTAQELSSYLRGWKSYFSFCQTPSVLEALDGWIRRRFRCMIGKQWKRGTVRFRNLRKAGVDAVLARKTAASVCGPWRVAHSPALDIAFPIAYFDSLGIPRLNG